MTNIKRFLDRVSLMDARSSRDLVLSANDARGLRDEIVNILLHKASDQLNNKDEVIKVEMTGGRW